MIGIVCWCIKGLTKLMIILHSFKISVASKSVNSVILYGTAGYLFGQLVNKEYCGATQIFTIFAPGRVDHILAALVLSSFCDCLSTVHIFLLPSSFM